MVSENSNDELFKQYNLYIARLNLIAFGYKHTNMSVRETLGAISTDIIDKISLEIQQSIGTNIILPTCNRFEIYISADMSPILLQKKIYTIIEKYTDIDASTLRTESLYKYGLGVIEYMFRVASGLESMVLGEHQIMSQIKTAYQKAKDNQSSDGVLNQLFQRGLSVGKNARTHTDIARGAISIPHVCYDIIKNHYTDLKDQQFAILGAGQISKIAVSLLVNNGLKDNITVYARHQDNAITQRFADIRCMPWHDFWHNPNANIIMVCTASNEYILNPDDIRDRDHDIMIYDLSMPRNVNPAMRYISNVTLYDLNDINLLISNNVQEREAEINAVQDIIMTEIARFEQWFLTKMHLDYQ